MTPPWWGIPIVVVVGLAVVWFGWWSDHRRARREAAALRAAPDRPLPGLSPGTAPEFTTEDDLPATPRAGPDPDADAAATDLIGRRPDAAGLPGGTPDPRFFTHPDRGLAALAEPSVLVLDAALADQRDVVTVLDAARRRGRPVVIVAPEFTADTVGTLRANAVTGRAPNLPVALDDARSLRKAVALTGGRLVPASDLRAGYLPDAAWGTCAGWVSDAENSWVVLESGARPSTSP